MSNVDQELKYSSRSKRARPAKPRHKANEEEQETERPSGVDTVDVDIVPTVDVGTVNVGTVDVDTVDIEALQKRLEELARSELAKDGKIEKLAAQFIGVQKDIDLHKRMREQEVAETTRNFSRLEDQLGTISDNLSGARRQWRWVAITFALIVTIPACAIFWRMWAIRGIHEQTVAAAPLVAQQDAPTSRAMAAAHGSPQGAASNPDKLPSEPSAAFTAAIERLDDAFGEFPGRSPEELLREASGSEHGCRLLWNDTHPSLLFGDFKAGKASLSSTLFRCAEAVSNLHR
jgi:hypothetical protein